MKGRWTVVPQKIPEFLSILYQWKKLRYEAAQSLAHLFFMIKKLAKSCCLCNREEARMNVLDFVFRQDALDNRSREDEIVGEKKKPI